MLSVIKQFDLNQKKIIFFLAILLIPSLITGPLFAEIILLIIFTIFIFNYKFYKNYNLILDKKIILFFSLFYIYINFNTALNTVSIDLSFKNTLFYFRFFFYSFIFFILIHIYQRKFFHYFFLSIIFFFVIFFIDLVFFVSFDYSISGNKFVTQRFSSLFGDELVMGGYVMKILPSLLICLVFLKKNNYFIFLTLVLSGILIIASGERTSTVHFLILLFCLIINKRFFKISIFFITLFSIIFISLYSFKFHPVKRIVNATISEINVDGRNDLILFSDVHENMLFTSFEIFKQNLYLGTGAKTYRFVCGQEKYSLKTKEKILNENSLFAKKDGHFYIIQFWEISNITSKPHLKRIMRIFYDDGEVENIDLLRYRLNLGKVNKAFEKLSSGVNAIISFKKNDLLTKISYDRQDGCDTHPHNLTAQFAAELGIFGLVFYVLFYLYFIIEFFKANFKKQNIDATCYYLSISSILINFIPFLPSGNFFNNWYSFLLYVPIGFYIFFHKKFKKTL